MRISLRTRLTALTVVLVALGLLAAGFATRVELQSFLIGRVDQQFQAAEAPALHYLSGDHDLGSSRGLYQALPRHALTALVRPNGSITSATVGTVSDREDLISAMANARPGRFTASGYRFSAVSAASVSTAGAGGPGPVSPAAPLPHGTLLVIATPLSDVNATLSRLVNLELLVGCTVLALVAILAYVMVRREFRPLESIEGTAAAIAAGDLTQRVGDDDPRTEVGRLGASLNTMLGQIEAAFLQSKRSEERLRRFVADASHELRTPLTSVRGYAELFRRGAAENPADLAIVMRRIEAEAERMGLLVDDLLLLGKLDQDRPFERGSVSLPDLVEDLVTDHRMLHPDWPITLETDAGCVVVGDPSRLRQAVSNLLSNARSHTPSGTRIDVSVRATDHGVVVAVKDHGPGIPQEHLEHLFERFYRADPSRARASGGSGLGLSIVEAIARGHEGSVEVESCLGDGATFRIVLPGDRTPAPAPSPTEIA